MATDGGNLPANVLLIEDDPDDQLIVGEMFAQFADSERYSLDTSANAEDGLRQMAHGEYEVVLLDYQLGAVSGIEVLAATRHWPDRPPIILLTGCSASDLDQEALDHGAADYLNKRGLTSEMLGRAVRYARERHRLMRVLAQRERDYRLLFEGNPIAMWLFEAESLKILEVNEAACKQYGYSHEEFLGLTILDLRPADERESLLAYMRANARPSGHWHHDVWLHQRKDGSLLYVEITSCTLDWKGHVARLVSGTDVTQRVEAKEALRRSEQTLRGVLNDMGDALLVVDSKNRVQFANPAAEDLFARSSEHLLVAEIDPDQVLGGPESDVLIDDKGRAHNVQKRTSVSAWNDEAATILVLTDITAQRATEQQLRLLQRSVDATNEGVIIVDARAPDMPMIYANPAFERITGYRLAEGMGRNCRFLQSADRDQPALDGIRQALAQQQSCVAVLRNYRKDGELFWNRLTLAPVRDERQQVSHYIGLIGDISEQKFLEAERNFLVTHDAVTGLPKYTGDLKRFDQLLSQSRTRELRLALLFIDIDSFHSVNDTLGYQMGDTALRLVADRLQAFVTADAELVRYAGDEFLLAIGDLDPQVDLLTLASSVCQSISEPMPVSANATLYLTCSVGASCFPQSGATIHELVRQADMATNRAKRNGRNCAYVFGNELTEILNDRLALGGRLRTAIARGEFLLHYQPQVNANDGAIVAVEALVRWNSPEFGLLHPRRFIPVAEDSGVIVVLGLHIMETAFRQARTWADQGLSSFLVSINVSGAQIQRPSFVEDVRQLIHNTGVDPAMIEFEITESVLMDNAERAVDQLQQLKSLGLQLALDDFGIGYSSLGYLRRFPINKLKIDQSFVQDITTSSSDAALVRAMIAMGHHLGMRVVAEGVETAAQCGYLRRAHCDELQGYYFSEPVPADAIPQLVQRRYLRPPEIAQVHSERVLLLLDDEENILRSLVRLLRRDGYRILTASSAAQAFELLATIPVQVILSDQRMPAMSGTEFLSKVKLMYPDTIRIVLSGYTDIASVTESINRGAIYKFLTKPWDDEHLRMQVQEAFRRYEQNPSSGQA